MGRAVSLRILHISTRKVSPNLSEMMFSGDLRHFKALAKLLGENYVLCRSTDSSMHTIVSGNLTFYLVPALLDLIPAALAKSFDFDLIVSQNPFMAGFAGVLAGLISRKPCLVTVHGYRFTVSRFWDPMKLFVYRHSTLIRADSEAVKEDIVSCGVSPRKVVVLRSRVNCEMFNPKANGRWVRLLLDIGERPMVLYAGLLLPIKGVDVLIRASKLVLDRIPEAFFVIAGEGPWRGELEKLASDMGVGDSVRFVGRVIYDDMPSYMAAMDVLVHPSYTESLGRVLLEAEASSKPVVAARAGGVPEAVVDGETALLFPPGNVEALADTLTRVLSDMKLRKRMGERGRRLVVENYEFWSQEKKLVRLYERIVEKQG